MVQNNLLRVTQVNSVYLDNEILKCFEKLICDAAKYLPPKLVANYTPEFNVLLKLLVLYYSLVKTCSTYGQHLLTIKYSNLSPTKKYLYLMGNALHYIKTRLEGFSKFEGVINHVDAFLKVYSVVNISCFLLNGTKPRLIERILGLEQVYAHDNAQRRFDSKYLARELLWNGLIEMLVYVLPLINYHKIRRTARTLNPFHKKTAVVLRGVTRNITIHSKCAYCGEIPILPHHMGCAHIFCYVCLKGNQIADSKFQCTICDYASPNTVCERVLC